MRSHVPPPPQMLRGYTRLLCNLPAAGGVEGAILTAQKWTVGTRLAILAASLLPAVWIVPKVAAMRSEYKNLELNQRLSQDGMLQDVALSGALLCYTCSCITMPMHCVCLIPCPYARLHLPFGFAQYIVQSVAVPCWCTDHLPQNASGKEYELKQLTCRPTPSWSRWHAALCHFATMQIQEFNSNTEAMRQEM
eukprot:gene2808-3419_t